MNTKKIIIITLSLAAGMLFANCSDKSFVAQGDSFRPQCVGTTQQGCVSVCTDGVCTNNYDYEIDAVTGMADILFVVDNSGSMYQEQEEMGTKFPSFLNSIADLDYRIGITTTDIAGSGNPVGPNHGNGALQDGRLIQYASGQYFLDGTYDLSSEESLFLQTVKRDETLNCNPNNLSTCPSGDERGILAAHMTLSNNYNNFVREDGHMAIIFLSDEDERSDGDDLSSIEQPVNFIDSFRQMYPKKSLKAHSIIIRPGDQSCLNQQTGFQGYEGYVYAELSDRTGGILGNICANSYSSQLQEIGEDVAQPRQVLDCRPINDEVEVTFIPEPPYTVEVTKNLANNEILFSSGLPKGTKIRFQYSCSQ